MDNNSDLEFLSLADKIARDYKLLLSQVFDASIDASDMNDLTACRILMSCYRSEEPMSTCDMEEFLRLEEVDFSKALIKLIGLQYAYTEGVRNTGHGKLVRLTSSGQEKAKEYCALFEGAVSHTDQMSSLRLTDVERDNIFTSLITLQNRTRALLSKFT